ncbi:hypothetical protein Taro_005727 [Colocasia esculenta]|uniref:Uncharacterized protein n=1 Tax=Colocasia esculenta TaxID=4460 RepID=A0A843TT74_COLES|nr:hypothetical protein [Colocasia esculenta]
MATAAHISSLFGLLLVVSLFQGSMAAPRKLAALVEPRPTTLTYHKGHLLTGPVSINLVWYGKFTPAQHAIVADFVSSLSEPRSTKPLPTAAAMQQDSSVASWWKTVQSYYAQSKSPLPVVSLGKQVVDDSYSMGRSLTSDQLLTLAARGGQRRAINVVLTAEDIAVDGFCTSRCGSHSASPRSKSGRFAYVWVGNSASQCPGQCA